MDLLRLPTELIWLVLDLSTPATKVQTIYALGWFDHFWPAVFAMRMEDIIELIKAVGRDDVLSLEQTRFYMCVIRNWCYRYISSQDSYDEHGIAAHDIHFCLLEMWMLYNDTNFLQLKEAAARAGHIENYKWLMKLDPQPILDDVEIAFWAGNETLARYLLKMNPALTTLHVSMAIRKLPISLLQEIYETYADMFDNDDVLHSAARSCRVEVLAWLRTKIDRCVTRRMLTYSASSRNVSREVLQWYANNGYKLLDGDSLFDYSLPDDTVIRLICVRNNLNDEDSGWHRELVMGGHRPTQLRQHPDLKALCQTNPFDAAAATAYCLQHSIQFTDRDLLENGLDLPVLKWMNAYNIISPSTTILRFSVGFYEHDPDIMVWLLKERNDPITVCAMTDVAASGITDLYAMIHDKFTNFIASRWVLYMAAVFAPFDMIKLLFRRHPYLRKRKVLRWLYQKKDDIGTPRDSILIFLEVALQMQEAKASHEIKMREDDILARCTSVIFE